LILHPNPVIRNPVANKTAPDAQMAPNKKFQGLKLAPPAQQYEYARAGRLRPARPSAL
jgi:hypothetical protein